MNTIATPSRLTKCLAILGLLCSLLPVYSGSAAPQESKVDALRAEARQLKNKAEELRNQGAPADAEKLAKESEKLWQTADKIEKEQHAQPELHQEQHAQELRREADRLRAKLEELRGAGKEEAAARLKEHIVALERQAEGGPPKPGPDKLKQRLQNLKNEIAELHKSGRHEEAERLESEAKELMSRRPAPRQDVPSPHALGAPPPNMGEGERRMHHLQIAIDNLHAAGMHEPAERLAREAQEMQRHFAKAGGPFQPFHGPGPQPEFAPPGAPGMRGGPVSGGPEPLLSKIQQLEGQLQELRQAVHELSKRLEGLRQEHR